MSKKLTNITLTLGSLDQLLTVTDPTIFPAKRLDEDAADYIYGQANTNILRQPVNLTISLPKKELHSETNNLVETMLRQYFTYQEQEARRDLSRLFRQGRMSLLLGTAFIFTCLAAAVLLNSIQVDSVWRDFLVSGLTIAAWVALWQPVEIFLYDWWPIRRDIKVYQKLSQMQIEVVGR